LIPITLQKPAFNNRFGNMANSRRNVHARVEFKLQRYYPLRVYELIASCFKLPPLLQEHEHMSIIGCDSVFTARILMWHGTFQVDNCSNPATRREVDLTFLRAA
jgi:hypothetical protein